MIQTWKKPHSLHARSSFFNSNMKTYAISFFILCNVIFSSCIASDEDISIFVLKILRAHIFK